MSTLDEDVRCPVRKLGFESVSLAGQDRETRVTCAREHREEVSLLVFMNVALSGFTLDHLLDFRKPGPGLPHFVFFNPGPVR